MDNSIFKGKRVLLLQDDPSLLELWEERMQNLGAIPVTCGNNKTASHALHQDDINMAIVDWNIDERTGEKSAATIRQLMERRIPTLVITATDDKTKGLDRLREEFKDRQIAVVDATFVSGLKEQISFFPHKES